MIDLSVLRAITAAGATGAVVLAAVEAMVADQSHGSAGGPTVAVAQQTPPCPAAAATVGAVPLPVVQNVVPITSPSMTVPAADRAPSSLSFFKNLNLDSKKKRKKEPEPALGLHTLPDDWQIKPSHLMLARKLKVDEDAARTLADELCDWAVGKGVLKANWDKYFNSWIRRKASSSPAQHRMPLMTLVPQVSREKFDEDERRTKEIRAEFAAQLERERRAG